MKYFFTCLIILSIVACAKTEKEPENLKLWYRQPATTWNEALPIGNGRLGAMVFGGVENERIQFNEETLWMGEPHDYSHAGASDYLEEIRELLFKGKQNKAQELAMKHFMSVPLGQMAYQPFGDIFLEFPDHERYTDYRRELNISKAIHITSYQVDGVNYQREVFASHPDNVIVMKLLSDDSKALNFNIKMTAPHEEKSISVEDKQIVLNVSVTNGALKGTAILQLNTDGTINSNGQELQVRQAGNATLLLSAATNFVNYEDVSQDAVAKAKKYIATIENKEYESIKKEHIEDYQNLFDRFSIDLGSNGKDSLSTGERLQQFEASPEDPQFIAQYVQYGRYLMISASREGTQPANLQGIWNKDMKPAWDSKYTVNINTEMNYWPAEVTNLSECHEPLFKLIEDCANTGVKTAMVHYDCDGWVLHHNTDLWRGTAPINHSNHGMWVGGSGWMCRHLWEHYLFTGDETFLRERAYPIMKEAAVFYKDFLIKDPKTGWLISTPSNSPEIGGMVAGPSMDHQIIRSLFRSCVEATEILGVDQEFAAQLNAIIPEIAPNQIGQYGQLMEWMEDLDNPKEKHRHVSHLWGIHPGKDINWEESPELMEAAKQSLIFRGDDGTGWSLSWKINFWARLLDGDHAYELIKLLFRYVDDHKTNYHRGGSYLNLFDAHPPFQIDGNFGAPAGIVELFIQSHLSYIELLPAMPSKLNQGKIKGVCARGGFEIDFEWRDGHLVSAKLLSKKGNPCIIQCGDNVVEFETQAGEIYVLDGALNIK